MERSIGLALLLLALPVASASAQCRLCPADVARPAEAAPLLPLSIEVETALDLGRAADDRGGGGSIAIDERSGARRVSGLVDLGGMALKGVVRLSGAPGARVRISLPPSIRLTASDGGSADVLDIRADLPPDPVLDAQGRLTFAFGGRLVVPGGVSGELRGRVPIVANYQ